MDSGKSSISPDGRPNPPTIQVAATSRATAVAGALAMLIREQGAAEVHALDTPAIHQAVKAIIIARRYLHEEQVELVCTPAVLDGESDEQRPMSVRLLVEQRSALTE